jgi:serine/threonine protein kinase
MDFTLSPALISPFCWNGSVTAYMKANSTDVNGMRIVSFDSQLHDVIGLSCLTTAQINEIVTGLSYLHSRDVVHGDLKPVSLAFTT